MAEITKVERSCFKFQKYLGFENRLSRRLYLAGGDDPRPNVGGTPLVGKPLD